MGVPYPTVPNKERALEREPFFFINHHKQDSQDP